MFIAISFLLVFALPLTARADEAYCVDMRAKYGIIPGQSFGSLPESKHEEYLNAKCYRFFCEPHKRAGRGKFKCVPKEVKTKEEELCDELKSKYSVIPGSSFGSMPIVDQDVYLKSQCDRFFCEPHPKAGKGVYDCVPIRRNASTSD
jgi:hypothetical protein